MNYDILVPEVRDDPLGRGYAGMTNAEVAARGAVVDRTRPRTSVTGDETFGCTVAAEFAAMTDAKRQLWLAFCARDVINPNSAANGEFVKWLFGVSSETLAALVAVKSEPVSRWDELGLSAVGSGHIDSARRRF